MLVTAYIIHRDPESSGRTVCPFPLEYRVRRPKEPIVVSMAIGSTRLKPIACSDQNLNDKPQFPVNGGFVPFNTTRFHSQRIEMY